MLDKPAVLYAMKIEHNSDGTFNRLKVYCRITEYPDYSNFLPDGDYGA